MRNPTFVCLMHLESLIDRDRQREEESQLKFNDFSQTESLSSVSKKEENAKSQENRSEMARNIRNYHDSSLTIAKDTFPESPSDLFSTCKANVCFSCSDFDRSGLGKQTKPA